MDFYQQRKRKTIKIRLFPKDGTRNLTNSGEEEDSNRIVGGHTITINEAPHQVNLRYRNQHICGGIIISARHCLTAAHCHQPRVPANRYNVIVGTNVVSGNDPQAFRTPVLRFLTHNQFDPVTNRNDIAVLVLQHQLPLNAQTIVAIGLPAPNARLPFGRDGTVTGW